MAHLDARPSSIRVVSLNCWGLKFISKHRNPRLTEIGVQIAAASPRPEIVGLQECWTQQDYLAIREKTRDILPHGKYYHSGIFGGGLAILSRWPIEESNMYRYPLNGRPTAFYRGDWFVGKGVASATVRIGPKAKDTVEVFCTHLHAPYEREPNDSYICHRTAQAWEIAKLMRGAAKKGHLVLGLGDFNMIPSSLAHALIETHGCVSDTWKVLHPDASLGAAEDLVEKNRDRPTPSAMFNITENGTTCDSPYNTWRWSKSNQKLLDKGKNIDVDGDALDLRAKRLDYIFYGNESSGDICTTWSVKEVQVGMKMRHPTLLCSLSDHFSIEATLSIGSKTTSSDKKSKEYHSTVLENPQYLSITTYDEILAMITKYYAREMRQRQLRLAHFGASVAISIGLLIAIWWSPHNYVAFILMLVSMLSLSAGVIDGLIGGLFVGSEMRALREFEWEILNTRERAVAATSN